MYIEPNTDIFLLSGINWTNNYEDTVYFTNKSVQINYMKGKIAKTFTQQSYQRHSKGTLRILSKADALYNCNYLMFQNTSYGSKWFYAFITNCEYINDNTTEISYEIDEIQTWFWDLELGQCFVEREIPKTDGWYENLVPENLETGDYIDNGEYSKSFPETALAMTFTKWKEWNEETQTWGEYKYPQFVDFHAYTINDVYSPCPVISYRVNHYNPQLGRYEEEEFYDRLKMYIDDGHEDDIVNIQLVPYFCVKNMKYYSDPSSPVHYAREEWDMRQLDTIDGYIPKNRKLYTYPYCVIVGSNQSGQIKEYKWELFTPTYSAGMPEIRFELIGTYYANPAITCAPILYRGSYHAYYDECLTLTNFPPVAWVGDTFKAYLAQNKASIATSILSDVVSTAFSVSAGINSAVLGQAINNNAPNPLWNMQLSSEAQRNAGIISAGKSGTSGVGNIIATLAKITDIKAAPNKVSNLSQADAFNLIVHNIRFAFKQKTIRREMAKIIDDYFSAYGYAQHKIKIPDINARPYWSYVKTRGCILKGSCPATTKSAIAKMFDNGIRFWNSNEVVGDYTLNNRP